MNENKTPVQPVQEIVTEQQFVEPQGDSEEQKIARAKLWKQRFIDAESNQQGNFKKYGDWYGLMYAAINTPKMALWRSKAFLPIITAKVWDLVSRFVQYRPSWEVKLYNLPISLPTQELQNYLKNVNQKYDKVKAKMDYDYDDPVRKTSIHEEHFNTLVDAVVTGTGIARVDYRKSEDELHDHPTDVFGNLDYSLENVTKITNGFNNYESINIFNFYKDPTAKHMNQGWHLIKDTATKAELQNHPEYDQQVINELQFGAVTDTTAQYQQNKRRLEGTPDPLSADSTGQKCWIFDAWDLDSGMHTVYAMGGADSTWREIFREKNPYWHKKSPYVRFVIRQKPHVFWGESIFENSESLQLAMNDLFNHYMDNYNMSDGMLAIEEGSVVEPYIVEPGGEFRYRGEVPKQLKFPEPNPAQLTTIMNRIDSVIENVTISQYASGVPNSATDNTAGTATGVSKLMEAATEKIGMMRANIRNSWAEVGNIWLMNSQQFMGVSVPVERTTGRGIEVDIVSPFDIQGNFVLRVGSNSFEPISDSEKLENYKGYVANIQSFAQASREQAEANGNTEGILNVDYVGAAERLSELSGENSSTILLDAPIAQVEPTAGIETSESTVDSLTPAEGVNIEALQGLNSGVATPDQQPFFNAPLPVLAGV